MAAISPLPCSLTSTSASSTPCFPSAPESPPPDTVAAVVPFLWEEKPGISKQNGDGTDNVASSKRSAPKQPGQLQLFIGDLNVLPLPMPPRLQKPSRSFELNKADGTCTPWNRSEQKRSVAADSPSKKRQPRKDGAEDDPFLKAIQACTARNGTEPKGSCQGARKLSRNTVLQKLFENGEEPSAPNKSNGRASHLSRSLSVEVKPSLGLKVRHADPRQVLEEHGHQSAGLWRYSDQKNSTSLRTKSGVMELQQRRLMLGSCLGCRNPEGYEPSSMARAKATPSSSNY